MRCSHIAVMQTADAALAGVETCAAIVLWTRAAGMSGLDTGPPPASLWQAATAWPPCCERLRQLAGRLPQAQPWWPRAFPVWPTMN